MTKMKFYIPNSWWVVAAFMVFLAACKEGEIIYPDPPANPYDNIDYSDGVLDDITVDSSSFLGVHHYIMKPKCAVPGCHDGSFEPDFRTIWSAYATTVNHPNLKNDADGSFSLRVDPGNSSSSWLYERITTDDPVLGRMPLYDTLYPEEIEMVRRWIADGAADLYGNSPIAYNAQPSFYSMIAYVEDTNGLRIDTFRTNMTSPIPLPSNTDVELWIGLKDFGADFVEVPGNELTYNKIKFSTDPYNFDGVPERQMELMPEAYYAPVQSNVNFYVPYYHRYRFNTGELDMDRVYFIRFYAQDADHDEPTEIPDDNAALWKKSSVSVQVIM